ncbi:thiol:disulfide interchange protein DsbA/DsbL [Thiocystis violascens]|uniref:Thiol:disulfide interchange protein n=1 Tax=Thiocystis violascens (strain ATCC 17096 / DSM 198 / 6111) TaxID=765911 RepID=I3YG57_THIV6|nr:thiol:disulfide interchange protein DsbA/DsbL [Thiocystis violascens]AFL75975.1 putative dithiol-disulfide isomerase involved in polyketide biosynthesis [Thiocystis violascens DSM 198]
MFGQSIIRILFGLLLTAQANAFDEGFDYARLAQAQPTQTGDKVEVLEVFMYGCPHCRNLEPALVEWLKTLPEGAAFRRMPATGWRWVPQARAHYAARSLGKLDVFHPALFDAIHAQKRLIQTEDELVAFAAELGMDATKFRAAYNSPEVQSQVSQDETMVRSYGVENVPTLIVNGKYRVSLTQAGGHAHLFEVLDALLAQELGKGS